MSEPARWGLIGYGKIGGEVARQLGQEDVAARMGLSPLPSFIVRRTGIMEPDGETPSRFSSLAEIDDFPEVTFIALPSTNDGIVATEHISHILERGKVAVTAEKGSLANNFALLKELSDGFRRLGINAAYGGGTREMDVAKIYCRDLANVSQIHLVPNGTTTGILSLVGPRGDASPMSLGQAVEQALVLKYADPGSETPEEVIKQEVEGDIPKKTAIYFNNVGLSPKLLNWHDLRFELSSADLQRVRREARIRRFIVSLYSQRFHDTVCPVEEDIISGFDVQHDGWQIVGGFQHVESNPLFADLARLTGPGNGAVYGLGPYERDGVYHNTGPGAGVGPTVNTKLDDWLRIRDALQIS
ncbi:MAG TPA: hypothetical protein VM124_02210 [Candidatus Limnocylindrales bacterium]|nr:hypothetical protein [Candidatus Limnocylindrales bacterium]